MRALVWIAEDSWQATVAEAAAHLPADADVTLLHVADAQAEGVVAAARHALLGRPHGEPRAGAEPLPAISAQAAQELLAEALAGLGRPATLEARRGRVEREVVAAAAGMDLLVLARDRDCERLGPRSLGPLARFVVDHAPCRVLLIWPNGAPGVATLPPPPRAPGAANG
ncbi:MAG: universal stress protein [Solirubrobacteraceae bacterium]|jgi:nucleotide-binding universal stress UspA family protein